MKNTLRIPPTLVALVAGGTALVATSVAQAANYPLTTENSITDVSTNARVQWSDLDADGDGDVILVRDTLSWLEMTDGPSAEFVEHVIEPEIDVYEVATGDIDGDGDIDLVGGGGSEIRWYENVENAAAFVGHTVAAADAHGVAVGDFDNDGDLDIALADPESGEPAWFRNPGDGTGDWGSMNVIPSGLFATDDVVAGDFDGDGDDDLMAADAYNGYLSLLTFDDGPWVETTLPTDGGLNHMRPADYDEDGDLDLLSGRSTIAMVVTNVAPGVFGSEVLKDTGFSGVGFALDVGDIDADGDLDVVAFSFNEASWFENDGGTYIEHDLGAGSSIAATDVSVMDVDCDGDADVVAKAAFSVRVYVNETNDGSAGCDEVDPSDGDGDGDGGPDGDGDGDDGVDDGADDGGTDDDGDDGDGPSEDDGGPGEDDGGGSDDGGDGTDGGALDEVEDAVDGLCSVDPNRGVPASALVLLMLAAVGGARRRR